MDNSQTYYITHKCIIEPISESHNLQLIIQNPEVIYYDEDNKLIILEYIQDLSLFRLSFDTIYEVYQFLDYKKLQNNYNKNNDILLVNVNEYIKLHSRVKQVLFLYDNFQISSFEINKL